MFITDPPSLPVDRSVINTAELICFLTETEIEIDTMNKPILILVLLAQLLAPIARSGESDDSKFPYPQPTLFSVYSWPEGQQCECKCKYYNPDIGTFIREHIEAIAGYCGFDLEVHGIQYATTVVEHFSYNHRYPARIDVALDSAGLRSKIQSINVDPNYYSQVYESQVLLISREYHLDAPIRVAGKVRLCGLRGWLRAENPELLAVMDSVSQDDEDNHQEYSTSCGACDTDSGSGTEKLLPESYNHYVKSLQPPEDDDRVRLIFKDNEGDYPSLLVTKNIELSHLRLYRVGQPGGTGLLAISCAYRSYFCPYRNPVPQARPSVRLRDTVIEDMTGGSDFLIRIDRSGSLIAESTQMNFVHNNNSTVIDANQILEIQLSHVDINNIGEQGTALTLKGYHSLGYLRHWRPLPSFLKNININAWDGASITGVSLEAGDHQTSNHQTSWNPDDHHTAWRAGDRLQLTGVHFGKGIKTGFLFTDDSFRLRATGNTGNTWASHTGEHCTGQPASGSIDFTDGTRCQEIVPVASVEVPITTTPTPPESTTVVSAAPSVLPELPAKVTSGTGTVHKSGLWAGLLSLYALLSVYY